MKKLLFAAFLISGSICFGQTYESSKIVTAKGIKNESHTVTLNESTISYDGTIYKVEKTEETKGTIRSYTYSDDNGTSFTFVYKGKKVFLIYFIQLIDGVKTITQIYKPKVK